MILCDPFAINTVSKSVIKQLQRLVNSEVLPRVSLLSHYYCLISKHQISLTVHVVTKIINFFASY